MRFVIRSRSFVIATLQAGVLFASGAAAVPPLGAPDDAFVCYGVRSTPGTASFAGADAALSDALHTSDYRVKKAKQVCVPADVEGEGILDSGTHLLAYKAKPMEKAPKQPGLGVDDRFGRHTLDARKPIFLLVAAHTDPDVPPSPPDRALHAVEDFACYKVKESRNGPRFEKTTLSIADGLAPAPRDLLAKKPAYLCTPTARDGQAVADPAGHLVCYKARPGKGEPKHAAVEGLHSADALGSLTLDTRKELLFCARALMNPTCGDGSINQASEICDGADDAACPGLCQADCSCLPEVCGDGEVNQPAEECDGADDSACPGACQPDCTCVPLVCGDGTVNQAGEECDGADDGLCPGFCQGDCTCAAAICGDGVVNQPGEVCDGADDAGCPGFCQPDCTCTPDVCGNNVQEGAEACDGVDDATCPDQCSSLCSCPTQLTLAMGAGSEAHANPITGLLGGPIPLGGDLVFDVGEEMQAGVFPLSVPLQTLGPIVSGLPIIANVCVYVVQDPGLPAGVSGNGVLHCGSADLDLAGNALGLPQTTDFALFQDHCVEGLGAGGCDTGDHGGGGLVDDVSGLFVPDGVTDPECDDAGSVADAAHSGCSGGVSAAPAPALFGEGDSVVSMNIVIETGAGPSCTGPPPGAPVVPITLTTGTTTTGIMDVMAACTAFACPGTTGGTDVAYAFQLSGSPYVCPDVLMGGGGGGAELVGSFPGLDVPQALGLDLVTTIRFVVP
jgi:hypothetical protein